MRKNIRQHSPTLCVLLLAIGPTGCQMGPSALKVSNAYYSEAVRIATSEQLLVNLVRLRYRDMPVFLNVSSISTQSEFNSSLLFQPLNARSKAIADAPEAWQAMAVGPFHNLGWLRWNRWISAYLSMNPSIAGNV